MVKTNRYIFVFKQERVCVIIDNMVCNKCVQFFNGRLGAATKGKHLFLRKKWLLLYNRTEHVYCFFSIIFHTLKMCRCHLYMGISPLGACFTTIF